MDNIFEKGDSGDESEHNDIEDKENRSSPLQNSPSKDTEAVDENDIHVKV